MTRTALLVCTLVALAGLSAHADDKKPADNKAAEKAAMMAAWMKHATPGDAHKKLEPMVGTWSFVGKMYEDPAGPPSEFKGTTVRKWILDGRFLYDETTSSFEGMPFQGIGYTGYDNSLKKYHGVWLDNMTTSVMTSTGTVDASGKVFTNQSETVDPMTGQKVKGRDVTTIVSNDEHKMVMYKIADGKEVKAMEISFKRKK
jgi:Protein of unknown function (DUF1579)